MRLVLDTNVLIGALITKGTPPDQLYQAWIYRRIDLAMSAWQRNELAAVLDRPRLQRYLDADEAALMVENIDTRAHIVAELPEVNFSPDSKDNPILATAIAGQAELIVSGDKAHMLALGQVGNIPIVTARGALAYLEDL